MPRLREDQDPRSVFRCVEPFATFRAGVPEVYAADSEVLDGDPVLRTHRAHFEAVADRVVRRSVVEAATAAPGELRSPVVPVSVPVPVGRSSVSPVSKEFTNG